MTENTPTCLTLYTGRLLGIDRGQLEILLSSLQETLFQQTGVITPPVRTQSDDSLQDKEFQLAIGDRRLEGLESIGIDEFWVLSQAAEQVDGTERWGRTWSARPSREPVTGADAAIVKGDEAAAQIWTDNGYTTFNALGQIIFLTLATAYAHASEFLTPDLVEYYLTRLHATYPVLVDVVRQQFDTAALTGALQRTVKTRQSIRDLRGVLEELVAQTATEW